MIKQKRTTYELIRTKPEKGLELLYEMYGKKLYYYAVNSWKTSEDDAWDLIYKTLFRIVKITKDYKFEDEHRFGSFVFTIFCNTLRNYYKKNKKLKERLEILFFNEQDINKESNSSDIKTELEVKSRIFKQSIEDYWQCPEKPNKLLELLKKALNEMEDWERSLLILRSQSYEYKEIARYIDKPENQLKVYYQRCKQKLLKKINKYIGSEISEEK